MAEIEIYKLERDFTGIPLNFMRKEGVKYARICATAAVSNVLLNPLPKHYYFDVKLREEESFVSYDGIGQQRFNKYEVFVLDVNQEFRRVADLSDAHQVKAKFTVREIGFEKNTSGRVRNMAYVLDGNNAICIATPGGKMVPTKDTINGAPATSYESFIAEQREQKVRN